MQAELAEVIVAGGYQGLDRDTVAGLEVADIRAGGDDLAAELVAEGLGAAGAGVGTRLTRDEDRAGDVFVQVGAADAAEAVSDQDLVGLQAVLRGRRHIFDADIAGGMEADGFHRDFLWFVFRSRPFQVKTMPPSTSSDWPVMKSLSDEARKRATPTRSWGVEGRPSTAMPAKVSKASFSRDVRPCSRKPPSITFHMSVATTPGQIALTLMWSLPKARAAAWVRATTANLLAE